MAACMDQSGARARKGLAALFHPCPAWENGRREDKRRRREASRIHIGALSSRNKTRATAITCRPNPVCLANSAHQVSKFPLPTIGPLGRYESEKVGKFSEQMGLNRMQIIQFECPKHSTPEAGSQKRVWICMDLYGSVRMSMDLQNLGPSKKYKMLISSCVCRNYDSASC